MKRVSPRAGSFRNLARAAALTVSLASAAQTAPPLRLSVDEALRIASDRSEQVAISRAGLIRAQGERYRALSEYLPQVNGSASYDRTLRTEFETIFQPAPTDGAPPDGAAGGLGDVSELPFGRTNVYRLGVTASQNLFAGGRSRARWALARAARDTAELGVASSRASVALDAAQAYYDAVLAGRLLSIAELTQKQAEVTLEQIRVGRSVGSLPEFDLLRAQVTVENQKPAVLQRRVERDIAYLRLKQLLEVPLEQPILLTSQLDEQELATVSTVAREVADAPPADARVERMAVRQAGQAVQVQEAAVRVARAQRYPQVNLSTAYGLVNYPDALAPEWDDWRVNWTVGVALQVPLFTGLRITGDERVTQAGLAEARARLRQTEELASLDTRTAEEQLRAAEASWKATSGAVQQAQRAYEIAEIRYREGISTQLELSDSRLLLQQAEANRARAARDVQVARIRLSLLPNLPLAGSAASAAAAAAGAAQDVASGATTSAQGSSMQGGGAGGPAGAQPPGQTGTGR